MNLLDTSPDSVRAAQIQRLQMEAERPAAYALENGLALDLKVDSQQPPSITVREARDGS